MKKAICLLLAVMMLATVGCSKEEPKEQPVVEKEEQKFDLTIGNKSEDAFVILLKNNVKQGISGIMIKSAEQEEYPENMMKETQSWAQGEVAQIYYIPETSVSEQETEKAINDIYQVKFILEDGTEIEMSSLGIADIDGEAELLYEDDVIFISYTSKLVGKKVSTKEQELGAKQQREEAESESAEISDQSSQEQEVYEESAYVESAPVQGAAPAPEAVETVPVQQVPAQEPASVPEAPVQSEEGCLTGVEILNP